MQHVSGWRWPLVSPITQHASTSAGAQTATYVAALRSINQPMTRGLAMITLPPPPSRSLLYPLCFWCANHSLLVLEAQPQYSPPVLHTPRLTLRLKPYSFPCVYAYNIYILQLISLLLVAINVVCSVRGTQSTSDGNPLYFFFEGRWSLPSSLLFVVVVYHIR